MDSTGGFDRPAVRLVTFDETMCDKIERLLLHGDGVRAGEVNFIAFGDWHYPCEPRNREPVEEGFLKNDPAAKVEAKPLISFEVKPMAGEDPALVLANSKRVFKRAWALLEVGKESV